MSPTIHTKINCFDQLGSSTEKLAVIQETLAQHGKLLTEILRQLGTNTPD
ncbi:MAG: hypothetical protein ACRDQ9_19395 [Pseudonocardiaceae bacterium]